MKPMLYAEAKSLAADGPFSFIDMYGARATRLNVCAGDVITAACCVEFRSHDILVIQTPVRALYGGAA